MTSDHNRAGETFVFLDEELKEIGNPRPKVAGFPKTNPCLLFYYKEFESYQKFIRDFPKQKLQIEYNLNKRPEKYRDRWSVIET